MEHYYGLKQIGERINIRTRNGILLHHLKNGLPMFKRADPKNRFRRVWYSNSVLIMTWELSLAKDGRERLLGTEGKKR